MGRDYTVPLGKRLATEAARDPRGEAEEERGQKDLR